MISEDCDASTSGSLWKDQVLVLFQTGHRAWMTGFAVMVGIPSLLWFLPGVTPVVTVVVRLLPLFMFYRYCWLLRSQVEEWLEN